MKSDKKIFWDKVSKVYDLFIKKDEKAYTEAIERIRRVLNADAEVLELATGERVIIVMGAVCVIKSRVSGTLTKYISCIA